VSTVLARTHTHPTRRRRSDFPGNFQNRGFFRGVRFPKECLEMYARAKGNVIVRRAAGERRDDTLEHGARRTRASRGLRAYEASKQASTKQASKVTGVLSHACLGTCVF
jgi:hypothetical protein